MKTIFLVSFLFATACIPQATSTPPDASDASATPDGGDLADQVCIHLGLVGCPQPPTCAAAFRAHQLPSPPPIAPGVYTDFKPACLLSASSAAAVIGCGTIACPTATK